jgi:membrane-associated protease RseP (regulator of RpoE activity)
MTKPRLKIALLALLLVVPTASRVSGGDDPNPAPRARKEKKKIVVATPEREIVVDDDGVFLRSDGEDPEVFAGLDDLENLNLPGELHWMSAGGYIGVRPIPMTPELRQHFGAPEDAGVFVGSVEKDGPAAKAGLAVGDIVTAVDGDAIASPRELARAVRRKKEGENVKIDFLRGGSKKTLTVKVARRKGEEIHLGDLGRGKRWRISPPEAPEPPMTPFPPRWRGLEDRIHELEQRLQELEGRLPK